MLGWRWKLRLAGRKVLLFGLDWEQPMLVTRTGVFKPNK